MSYLSRLPPASPMIPPRMVNTRAPAAHRPRLITRQSLCAEMASELRFAVRCGSRQRPAAKSRNSAAAGLCGHCSPRTSRRRTRLCSSAEHEETTYIPSIEIPRLNGVSLVPHDGLAISLDRRLDAKLHFFDTPFLLQYKYSFIPVVFIPKNEDSRLLIAGRHSFHGNAISSIGANYRFGIFQDFAS